MLRMQAVYLFECNASSLYFNIFHKSRVRVVVIILCQFEIKLCAATTYMPMACSKG